MLLQACHSFFGFLALAGLACLVSENRQAVDLRQALAGLLVQFFLALLLLKIPLSTEFFALLNRAVLALQASSLAGTSFVFGYLGGGDSPFVATESGATFILAFQALPLILLVSALSSLLFHWRVMPAIVRFFSRILQKSLNLGGALGVSAAANIFVGMVLPTWAA